MIRNAAYALLVVVFVVFAYLGVKGWRSPAATTTAPTTATDAPDPEQERDLKTGFLTGVSLGHYGSMGYPWTALREDLLAAKRDLPPEPGPVTAEDTEKANKVRLSEIKVTLKPGRIAWPQLFAALREQIERSGVKVTTGTPPVPDTYMIDLPVRKASWTGLSICGDVMEVTGKDVVFVVTCNGLNVGTNEACNRATRDGNLVGLRRRVAAENADVRLDAEFRPDVTDANIVAFVHGIEAQTGVEVAIDPQIWEMGPALTWRAQARPLRTALDDLCRGFRWYWRWYNGRVWLLKP